MTEGSFVKSQEDGEESPAPCPAFFFCAHILADKGGGGHGHAGHGQHNEGIQLVVAAPARHAAGTEGVDVSLDEGVGKGGDN